MKRLNRILLTSFALSTIACGGTNTSSVVSSNNESIDSSVVIENKWDEATSKMMIEFLGEEIPFIKLDNPYEASIVKDGHDSWLYLFAKDNIDCTSTYKKTLEFNDYELIKQDNSNGYPMYIYSKQVGESDQIIVQFDYFPKGAEELHQPGFEIFAWKEVYVDPHINYELVSDWSNEEKGLFNTHFGEIIPLAPLSKEHTYVYVEEDNNIIFTDPIGKPEALDRYFDLVAELKDWVLSQSYANRGWIVYEKPAENVKYGMLHLNMRMDDEKGFIVDVWMTIEEPPAMLDAWPEEAMNLFKDLFMEDDPIPYVPVSEKTFVTKIDKGEDSYEGYFINIIDPVGTQESVDSFIEILEEAGFVENTYYVERFGYHVLDKPSVIMPAFNIELEFMMSQYGFEIHVSKAEIFSGFGFTDTWPTERIKAFLDEHDCRYVAIPTFETDSTGQYCFGTPEDEPCFYLAIYNDHNKPLAEDYSKVLANAGWTISSYTSDAAPDGWSAYIAKKKGVDFYLFFWSDAIEFDLKIYPNSYVLE